MYDIIQKNIKFEKEERVKPIKRITSPCLVEGSLKIGDEKSFYTLLKRGKLFAGEIVEAYNKKPVILREGRENYALFFIENIGRYARINVELIKMES